MDKQANDGQGGVIGKQIAGQKRDQENLLAVEEDDISKKARHDLMSSSEYELFKEWKVKHNKEYKTAEEELERFHLWHKNNKEFIDGLNSMEQRGGAIYALNFFSDLTDSERCRFRGCKLAADDPYKGNARTPEFYESKLGKEVAEEEAAFGKWVAENKIYYGSTKERQYRFTIYFQNKKMIEKLRKEDPAAFNSTYMSELNSKMDQVMSMHGLKNILKGLPALSN